LPRCLHRFGLATHRLAEALDIIAEPLTIDSRDLALWPQHAVDTFVERAAARRISSIALNA
jgi:hypothetical protein